VPSASRSEDREVPLVERVSVEDRTQFANVTLGDTASAEPKDEIRPYAFHGRDAG
jgi:hypothetical protein